MAKINIPSVNDKLLDKYIRHSVWMEQLKAGEAAAISKMLKKDVFPQLYDKLILELGKVKNLGSIQNLKKIKRIKQMMASVEKTATAGAIRAGKLINQKMYNVAKFEAKWNAKTLEKAIPLDISLNTPSNAVLKQLVLASTFQGHRMQTWMKGYSKSVQAGIAKQLKIGVATGESLPAISKRLRKVLGSKAHQAETLARTSVSNIVHEAREATFKANKKLIRKVQMVATLDDKTTLICINYDGKVFNVGEGDRPPFHFNCRTTTVPVVTSWNEFGVVDPPAFTRASMNGAVPAKLNYRQWLKRQSKATQIKVLGKTRAELYRSGRVKIDKFVGKDYKPLSLKQLARKEGLGPKARPAPAPPTVKIISAKGTGKTLTGAEIRTKVTAVPKKVPVVAKAKVTVGKTAKVNYYGETSKEFQKIVDDHVETYPDNVKKALAENDVKFNAGLKYSDMDPTMKGVRPRGWPSGTDWDNCGGGFNPRTKSVQVCETTKLGYKPSHKFTHFETVQMRETIGTLNHETGHAFDITNPDGHWSSTIDFMKAYKKDVAALGGKTVGKRAGFRYFLQAGSAGRGETFAEIFGELMGTTRKNLKGKFPRSYKVVDDLVKHTGTGNTLLESRIAKPGTQHLIDNYNTLKMGKGSSIKLKAIRGKLARKGLFIDDAGHLSTNIRDTSINSNWFPKIKVGTAEVSVKSPAPAPAPAPAKSLLKKRLADPKNQFYVNTYKFAVKEKEKLGIIWSREKLATRGIWVDKSGKFTINQASQVKLPTLSKAEVKAKAKSDAISGPKAKTVKAKSVKAKSVNGTKELTSAEEEALESYTAREYDAINLFQRGKVKAAIDKGYSVPILKATIKDINLGLKKLPGYKGTSYRGLSFEGEAVRASFLKQFKKGSVWKSKTFQSTSKSKGVAKRFTNSMEYKSKGVKINFEGVSGRDIDAFSGEAEREVLFAKGTPFKVVKVKGNEVWLKEITKQKQH